MKNPTAENMELGQICFGNPTAGGFDVPRGHRGMETTFEKLQMASNQAAGGNPNDSYIHPFDNEVFSINPYYWGDCDCQDESEETPHKPDCPVVKPNFLHKPSGYAMTWYKYPFRGAYGNKEKSPEEITQFFKEALHSIGNATKNIRPVKLTAQQPEPMITKYAYPDSSLETSYSTCCCPPGIKRGGAHTRAFTYWARLSGGSWQRITLEAFNKELLSSFKTAKDAYKSLVFRS